MKVLKTALYQNNVNYRKEMSYGYVETYPLPTPSMIRGMAHAILDLKEYCPLKISIQGSYQTVVTNLQKVYKFDRPPSSRPSNPYKLDVLNSKRTATNGVMFVDEVVDMELILHIAFDDAALTQALCDAVLSETVVLGRNEDIARVDYNQTHMVEINEGDEDHTLKNNIFIPVDQAREAFLSGTIFRLPFCYKPVKSFKDKRIFSFVDVMYIAKDSVVAETDYLLDEDGDIACFLEVSAHE